MTETPPAQTPTAAPAPVPPSAAPPPAGAQAPAWPVALLSALLVAQLGLAWIHGRLLNRQHLELLQLREDLQGLAEAIEQSYADPGLEDGSLAPARQRHPRPRRVQAVSRRIQEGQEREQDPAARELEASRQSADKAVKDAKSAQQKLSVKHAAERAERAEKVDAASRNFFWASIGAAVVLFGAYAARGFIRRQRG